MKWSPFGTYTSRKGAKRAAKNYGLKRPIVRKSARKDKKGRTYTFDFKLFDKN